jgi:hypothetical protein
LIAVRADTLDVQRAGWGLGCVRHILRVEVVVVHGGSRNILSTLTNQDRNIHVVHNIDGHLTRNWASHGNIDSNLDVLCDHFLHSVGHCNRLRHRNWTGNCLLHHHVVRARYANRHGLRHAYSVHHWHSARNGNCLHLSHWNGHGNGLLDRVRDTNLKSLLLHNFHWARNSD